MQQNVKLNINWLSSRSASESAILAIQDIAKQYQEENPDLDFNFEIENILRCFDDFESDNSVSVRDLQDYQSIYIDLYQDYAKKSDLKKNESTNDIVFEIELIKQVEVNIDIS